MESRIYNEAYAFGLRIVKAYAYLTETKHEYEISGQLKRSGTSIGANLAEAKYAQSRADWIHKLSIALKEANETRHWLHLLHDCGHIDDRAFSSIIADCNSIVFKLSSMIRTAKTNLEMMGKAKPIGPNNDGQ